jgi:hypothetical protein
MHARILDQGFIVWLSGVLGVHLCHGIAHQMNVDPVVYPITNAEVVALALGDAYQRAVLRIVGERRRGVRTTSRRCRNTGA